MFPALIIACAADPRLEVVNLTDAPAAEIIRGARIALMESHHEGESRVSRWVGTECWEVHAAVPEAGTLSVEVVVPSESDVLELAKIPDDAVVRAGICRSDATPLARARLDNMFAVAIPPGVLPDFVGSFRTGDQVEMIASFTELPAFTTSLGTAMFVEPGFLSVGEFQGERWFQAVDTGRMSLALETRQGEQTQTHLATLVPEGMRFVAAPLPASASAIAAFISVAEEVDVTVQVDGQALRALRAVPVFPLEPARRTLVAAVTKEQTETWAHAVASVPVTLSLRLADDLRALAIPTATGEAVAVGDTVSIGAQDALGSVTGEVLDLGTAPGGEQVALVQVTEADVLAAAVAGALRVTRVEAD